MHIQLVNFNLKDMNQEEFHKLCDEVAPAFAAVPGLISKVWLADPAKNTYRGVYTWRDRESMESYFLPPEISRYWKNQPGSLTGWLLQLSKVNSYGGQRGVAVKKKANLEKE